MAKAATPKAGSQFEQFLNPNSMITPGAAGAMTAVVTNTLCTQFGALAPNYTALAMSFLLGAVVFGYGAAIAARVLYYVINSLIIFVVAHGSNSVGLKIESHYSPPQPVAMNTEGPHVSTRPSFSIAGAGNPPAGAQDQQQTPPPKGKFFRPW